MVEPKFTTGDTVKLVSNAHIPKGLGEFKIVRPLLLEHGTHGYRVQSLADGTCAWSRRAKLLSARRIERLARRMYEASQPAGCPWPHHGWDVRQAWLGKARAAAGIAPAAERLPVWHKIKLLLRL